MSEHSIAYAMLCVCLSQQLLVLYCVKIAEAVVKQARLFEAQGAVYSHQV